MEAINWLKCFFLYLQSCYLQWHSTTEVHFFFSFVSNKKHLRHFTAQYGYMSFARAVWGAFSLAVIKETPQVALRSGREFRQSRAQRAFPFYDKELFSLWIFQLSPCSLYASVTSACSTRLQEIIAHSSQVCHDQQLQWNHTEHKNCPRNVFCF